MVLRGLAEFSDLGGIRHRVLRSRVSPENYRVWGSGASTPPAHLQEVKSVKGASRSFD